MVSRRDLHRDRIQPDRSRDPLPLQIPVPEPLPFAPTPKEKEETTERGIWTIDI
jgi:hypothetical protein